VLNWKEVQQTVPLTDLLPTNDKTKNESDNTTTDTKSKIKIDHNSEENTTKILSAARTIALCLIID
jgi:hypothetical protein